MSNEDPEYTGTLEVTSARNLWLLEPDSCTECELQAIAVPGDVGVSQSRAATDGNLCLYSVQAG